MKTRILLTAAAALLGLTTWCWAQSGAASLHGWVAFENVAYIDRQPKAKVELRAEDTSTIYTTETDEHGFFDFHRTSLGRFKLVITAKGFSPYSADVYMASDFAGNWAVQLKVLRSETKGGK